MRTRERDGDKTGVRERKRKQLYSIHFDDFNSGGFFPSSFQRRLKRSILFTLQTTATHFQWLQNKEPWGELIYPQSPGGNECVSACGDGSCVFNASLLGGMGMRLLSGSGHIQYRGITPGSSEEMRTLSFPSRSVSLWWIKQITLPKKIKKNVCLACNACLSLLGGRKSWRRLKIQRDCDRVNRIRCKTVLCTKWL